MATSVTIERLPFAAVLKGYHMAIVTINWDLYITGGHAVVWNTYKLGKVKAVMPAGGSDIVATYDEAINNEVVGTKNAEIVVSLFVRATGAECADSVDLSDKTTKLLVVSY